MAVGTRRTSPVFGRGPGRLLHNFQRVAEHRDPGGLGVSRHHASGSRHRCRAHASAAMDHRPDPGVLGRCQGSSAQAIQG